MMKQLLIKSVIATLTVVSQFLIFSTAAFAQTGFTFTPILRRFDTRPNGDVFFLCDTCTGQITDFHAFNNRGDLLINAQIEGYCFEGLFLISNGNKSLIADQCRPTSLGFLNITGQATLNEQGQVIFTGYQYVNDKRVEMLLAYSNGLLTRVVSEGEATPSGRVFSQHSFLQPRINNSGAIVFQGIDLDNQGNEGADIYRYENGELRSLVTSGTASPIGGVFRFVRLSPNTQINSKGETLFYSSVYDASDVPITDGLFLITHDGIKKIIVSGDLLPENREAYIPVGSLNDKGEVAFTSRKTNPFSEDDSGVYLYTEGQIRKVLFAGEPTPMGGKFEPLSKVFEDFPEARINNNSAIAFKAAVKKGRTPLAIFLASPKAILKVVAVGDQVDEEKIADIGSFALNDLGQVAFFAFDKNKRTLGVYKATPATPKIQSVKLKNKKGKLELRINGSGFITNDTVIEINGVALDALIYPEEAREEGGTSVQVISRDNRLEQLLPAGQTTQVTVFNALTNQRSSVKEFVR